MTYKRAASKLIYNGVMFFYSHIISLQVFSTFVHLTLERFEPCRWAALLTDACILLCTATKKNAAH
jgi:hypothetical protein